MAAATILIVMPSAPVTSGLYQSSRNVHHGPAGVRPSAILDPINLNMRTALTRECVSCVLRYEPYEENQLRKSSRAATEDRLSGHILGRDHETKP